jgi:hypothetical protein
MGYVTEASIFVDCHERNEVLSEKKYETPILVAFTHISKSPIAMKRWGLYEV